MKMPERNEFSHPATPRWLHAYGNHLPVLVDSDGIDAPHVNCDALSGAGAASEGSVVASSDSEFGLGFGKAFHDDT